MRETRVEGERVAGEGESRAGAQATQRSPPPPPPRTKWTRRVPHPVLIGHAACVSTRARRRGRQSLEVVVSGHARDAVSPPPLCAPCRVELGGAAYAAQLQRFQRSRQPRTSATPHPPSLPLQPHRALRLRPSPFSSAGSPPRSLARRLPCPRGRRPRAAQRLRTKRAAAAPEARRPAESGTGHGDAQGHGDPPLRALRAGRARGARDAAARGRRPARAQRLRLRAGRSSPPPLPILPTAVSSAVAPPRRQRAPTG